MKFPAHSQDLWSQTWDALADIVEITDTEGILVYVNRAFETNYGYSAEDCVGRTLASLVRSDVHNEAFFDAMWSTLVRGDIWRGRVVSMARDGRLVHQETVVTPIRDASGEVRHFVGVKRVVNAQVELERRLRRHEQLAVLGQLAASVAHEINNPLTWIIANLEFFRGEFVDLSLSIPSEHLDEMEQMLGDSLDGAHRIRNIVQGLKRASTPVDEVAEACVFEDVHRALDQAIAIADHQLRHRATVVRSYGDVPRVLVAPGALGQVFLNLLVNAAQSIAPGDVEGNTIHCRTFSDHDHVTVEISDTGRGIAPDDLHRVFEPFVTTRKYQGGTGLGLAISRSLVSKCGGTLSVQSELGQRTTFTLCFPRIQPSEPEIAQPPASQSHVVTGRLLVIDDEPQMCAVLQRMLHGYQVDTQTSGRSGLQAVLDGHYDLILCDLMMPEITGMDLFRTLQSTRPDMADRVVFSTGGVTVPEVAAFLSSHSRPVLHKPFETGDVRELVAAQLATRNSRP